MMYEINVNNPSYEVNIMLNMAWPLFMDDRKSVGPVRALVVLFEFAVNIKEVG